jgi:hypothetical protein
MGHGNKTKLILNEKFCAMVFFGNTNLVFTVVTPRRKIIPPSLNLNCDTCYDVNNTDLSLSRSLYTAT